MASVRLWRRVSFWLWLSCLLIVVCSAPVNEENTSSAVSDGQQQSKMSDGLGAAIEAIRAKRDARKKSSKSGRSLVRYRYPIQVKRSGGSFSHDSEEDYDVGEGNSAEDEREDPLVNLIGDSLGRGDSAPDLDEMAKEIALDLLMDEVDKGHAEHRSSPSSAFIKKKKAAPAAHRPRQWTPALSLDDKRRKRMNSLVNQLMGEKGERDDYDERDDDERPAPHDNSEDDDDDDEDDHNLAPEGDDDDGTEEEEMSRYVARKLAGRGMGRHEIESLLSQLERSHPGEYKSENKKRSSEWRKLPRASLRWRFLHSHGHDDNDGYGRHHQDDEDEGLDNGAPVESRFFGRGFHRVGPSIQDETMRSIPSAKRVQHVLKTKNVVGMINKRSIDESSQGDSEKEQVASAQGLRKRRSPAMPVAQADAAAKVNETSPPLALPLAEAKSNDSNKSAAALPPPAKEAVRKDGQAHSGMIRKKSVDWDDYFGFDKRSKKSGHSDDEAMRDYIESEYYKTVAGSLPFRKRSQAEEQRHSGHISGMKKRSNYTASWEKKRRSEDAEDAEDALDAAMRVVEERRERNNLDRVREQLVADLVHNLDEEDLDDVADRLAEEWEAAIREEEEEEERGDEADDDDDDDMTSYKRSIGHNKLKREGELRKKKKKKSFPAENDERRKRFAIKRSQNGRHRSGKLFGIVCVF